MSAFLYMKELKLQEGSGQGGPAGRAASSGLEPTLCPNFWPFCTTPGLSRTWEDGVLEKL
jgi:hypothetical protein